MPPKIGKILGHTLRVPGLDQKKEDADSRTATRGRPSVTDAYEARIDTLRAAILGRSGHLEARTPQERVRCELACALRRASL